jgi:type IX secretion system PorP/SprF family membrane protein
MNKLIIILALIVCSFSVNAQQDAEYSMYFFNGLYINPAYTGSKENAHLSGLYRHQWEGIKGAPRSATVAFHSPLKKNQYALGARFNYDRLGTTQYTALTGSFAYRIKTNGKTKISLGVDLGVNSYNFLLATNQTNQGSDPTLAQNISTILPNFGLGVYVYQKKFYVGLSAPHLLNDILKDTFALTNGNTVARQYNHYFGTAGYVFGKESANVKFLPSMLAKWTPGTSFEMDFTANFLIHEFLMLGASWRSTGDDGNFRGESIIGIIKVAAWKTLEIGYAYDHTLSTLGSTKVGTFNTGTHELFLGYTFGDAGKANRRFVTPRFVTYF